MGHLMNTYRQTRQHMQHLAYLGDVDLTRAKRRKSACLSKIVQINTTALKANRANVRDILALMKKLVCLYRKPMAQPYIIAYVLMEVSRPVKTSNAQGIQCQ